MNRRTIFLKPTSIVIVLAFGAASQAAAADPSKLCQRLAAYARSRPVSAWEKMSVEEALAPALRINNRRGAQGAEAALAKLPFVRSSLGLSDWTGQVDFDQLPGTDIHALSTIQGTLHCQTTVFLSAKPGAKPVEITPPTPSGQEDGGLCWTQSGEFGRLFGQAAYFEHGDISDHAFDYQLKAVPWMGASWGPGCDLVLKFDSGFRSSARHCIADDDLCRAGAALAPAVAKAYAAYRTHDAENLKNKSAHFRFGPSPPPALEAAIAKQYNGEQFLEEIPAFPTFGRSGESESNGYSYSGFELLPLKVEGRWYIAGIGHDGVGWRESNLTLLGLYTEQNGNLAPKVGFEIQTVKEGLAEAKATDFPPPHNP